MRCETGCKLVLFTNIITLPSHTVQSVHKTDTRQVTVTRNRRPEMESDTSKMRMKKELETEPKKKIGGSKPVSILSD